MIARWNCGLEVYGWDMSTTHATSNPRTRLGDKWREPSKEPFLKQQPFERKMWNLDKRTSVNLGGTLVKPSAEPFGSPRWICPREPERVRKQFCPETFTMVQKNPKLLLLWQKTTSQKFYCIWYVSVSLGTPPFRLIPPLSRPGWINGRCQEVLDELQTHWILSRFRWVFPVGFKPLKGTKIMVFLSGQFIIDLAYNLLINGVIEPTDPNP